VPVNSHERFLASLTVRFITSAVPLKSALERFLPKLRQCSAVINIYIRTTTRCARDRRTINAA